jgi:hypothetical protein
MCAKFTSPCSIPCRSGGGGAAEEIYAYPFLTSVINGVRRSTLHAGHFIPGSSLASFCTGSGVGPRALLDW